MTTAPPLTAIINARLLDADGLHTVRLRDGHVSAVEPQPAAAACAPIEYGTFDASGALLAPALVDPHLHLDLAYSLDLVPENRSGTLLEAIAHWSAAKAKLDAEDVRSRALRAIHEEVSFGTGMIRSHVDVASAAGMRLCEGVLAARDASAAQCAIQLVAFPQDGLIRDPGAAELLRDALRAGVDLVGGIPHIERTLADGLRHLDRVFEIAQAFDADVDVHIDETDDPASLYTEHLAAMTIERGWQGRVTASHVCALSSYADMHAARVIDLLAEARVNVVTNPGVNLHLQGRFDRYPKRRGLTRVRELLARGVPCAAGQDCIRDPFYPHGNGCMLEQAFLLSHADHLSQPAQLCQAFEMICGMAARVTQGARRRAQAQEQTLGIVAAGAPAHLALFEPANVAELIRLRPRPRAVLHAGRRVV